MIWTIIISTVIFAGHGTGLNARPTALSTLAVGTYDDEGACNKAIERISPNYPSFELQPDERGMRLRSKTLFKCVQKGGK